MKYFVLYILLLLVPFQISGQQVYFTQTLAPNIKTLQVYPENSSLEIPVIRLNGDERLQIRFDEMSHNAHSFNYTVLHCNADWTLSSLNTSEYLQGYTTAAVTEMTTSVNTTYPYTNYQFFLPNDEMQFKVSGNYVIEIYEDGNKDKPLARACFSIVEPQIKIAHKLRGNTDKEIMGQFQQLDIDLELGKYEIREASSEIKLVVRQNFRRDNEVTLSRPTFIGNQTLSYNNQPALIFEGGNEYHNLDVSSLYSAHESIDEIKFIRPHHHIYLKKDYFQKGVYQHHPDVNGKFAINFQEAFENSHFEGDYVWVHFSLPADAPFFDGQLYLGGQFNYNLLNEENRLTFNNETSAYEQSLLLKQGGYNYQYLFRSKNSKAASPARVDGSFWQTGNEYNIFVYHRPWGERYDKLIGVKSIE